MALLERTRTVDEAGLADLRRARTDLLIERQDGVDSWVMETGPFRRYRRTITVTPATPEFPSAETARPTSTEATPPESVRVTPAPAAGSAPTGSVSAESARYATAGSARSSPPEAVRYTVTEAIHYKLAVPLWWPYLWFPFRQALASTDRRPRRRWWWPEDVVTVETATLIGHLGTIGMMAGYMGVLIGQTITFASSDFGAPDDVQANTLAAVRIGVLLSFFFLGRADRTGRRPLVLRFALAAIIFTFLGSLAPGMFALGASQTVARGLTTGLLTLITLASTEEVPASSRALSISFMTLTTGFGAALVIWVLPVADLFTGAWRAIYVVPLLFLPLLRWISKNLPETRRYTAAEAQRSPAPINWRRFGLIAGSAFVSALYLSPASQLRNEFLTDDLSFSAADVSVFQLAISLPATLAIPIGGLIADRHGRRWLGAGALAGSVICSAVSYQTDGWLLWLSAGLGVSLAAAALPALRGYQTELFPTRARGRVGGMIDVVGVAGSALGLVVVGQLAVRWDDLGSAIGLLVFAPLMVAVVIIVAYPETAGRELEEFNPADPRIEDL